MILEIELHFLMPGLNGSDGLIREHFTQAKKKKEMLLWMILEKTNGKIKRPIDYAIKLTYERHSIRLMDWDNACASFKHIGDSLVAARILKDDNPSIIFDFKPVQIKVNKKSEEKTIIKIEKIN